LKRLYPRRRLKCQLSVLMIAAHGRVGYTELEVDLAWQAWKASHDSALERAAVACESLGMTTSGIYERNHECASAIRALKDES
jgi:hypothetical protein